MKLATVFRIFALTAALRFALIFTLAAPVLAAPQLSLSPTSGARGTEVTLTGTNFASYVGDIVHIIFGDIEIADSPMLVPQDGTLMVIFGVPPNAASGVARVAVTNVDGIQLACSDSFTVVNTDIELVPEIGTVGTNVTARCEGLYVNGKATFYYHSGDARVSVGSEVVLPTGECTCSFTIPNSGGGNHRVVVQDAYGNQAEANFRVVPSVALEPASASIGAAVTVSGTGFHTSSNVTVCLGGIGVTTQRTDECGGFEAVITVPEFISHICDLYVKDEGGNEVRIQFTVAAGISLSKVTGHIGEEVTVNGTGFMGDLPVTISYDSTPIAEGVVGNNGAFSVSFNVPVSIHGNHEVTASDGANSVLLMFSVESVAPPAPELLLLENPDQVKPGACFDWEDVTDPSGITYTFQVATDANFSAIIFEKTGLVSSEYTVTKADKLRSSGSGVPYYWRVKAVDGASNESAGSTAQSFYYFYGWPEWLRYTVLAVVWILTGFFCFKVGRARA